MIFRISAFRDCTSLTRISMSDGGVGIKGVGPMGNLGLLPEPVSPRLTILFDITIIHESINFSYFHQVGPIAGMARRGVAIIVRRGIHYMYQYETRLGNVSHNYVQLFILKSERITGRSFTMD